MKAYKGFHTNADGALQCRDKTYRVGETYTEPEAELCQIGMHACLAPLDVFAYYPPGGSVYHRVELGGDTVAGAAGDSKVAATTLAVGDELSVADLVAAQVEYAIGRAVPVEGAHTSQDRGVASDTGYQGVASATCPQGAASATGDLGAASATCPQGAASATGRQGAASATGIGGAASATGDLGAASATGDWGAASAIGYRAAASATGDQGVASATGRQGAASATGIGGAASATGEFAIAHADGYGSKARGALGCGLTLAERDASGTLVGIAAVVVGLTYDGVTIEPDVYYWLRDGQIEVAE